MTEGRDVNGANWDGWHKNCTATPGGFDFMARRRSNVGKWGIVAGAIAGGALIPLLPAIKRRAMRATAILMKDHRMVAGLITTLEMTPRVNATFRRTLFDQIRYQLMIHTQVEEEILYPAMRNYGIVVDSKVDEAYREHQRIKDLLNDLGTMDPLSDSFDLKLQDLRNTIHHHVDEEENEMFRMLRERFTTERQEELGRRIHNRKVELKRRMAA
jgi:hemerythrin-like domain-containing protein